VHVSTESGGRRDLHNNALMAAKSSCYPRWWPSR